MNIRIEIKSYEGDILNRSVVGEFDSGGIIPLNKMIHEACNRTRQCDRCGRDKDLGEFYYTSFMYRGERRKYFRRECRECTLRGRE